MKSFAFLFVVVVCSLTTVAVVQAVHPSITDSYHVFETVWTCTNWNITVLDPPVPNNMTTYSTVQSSDANNAMVEIYGIPRGSNRWMFVPVYFPTISLHASVALVDFVVVNNIDQLGFCDSGTVGLETLILLSDADPGFQTALGLFLSNSLPYAYDPIGNYPVQYQLYIPS